MKRVCDCGKTLKKNERCVPCDRYEMLMAGLGDE